MKTLIRRNRLYRQRYYRHEHDFEPVAKNALETMFPGFWVMAFKALVLGEEGQRRRPDLALIDKQYRMWVVVEVELLAHSLEHHVLPPDSGSGDRHRLWRLVTIMMHRRRYW